MSSLPPERVLLAFDIDRNTVVEDGRRLR